MNRILTESHGKRIAVIENEFGEIGIDHALVINADEEVFEMNNGCICCTVRGDLIRILGNLMKRRDKFDHILVETTGMADPGPVAQTFFVDDDLRDLFSLDGIVTLVDAKHIQLHLEDSAECREQIAFADVLVLNKTDLVSEQELDALEPRQGHEFHGQGAPRSERGRGDPDGAGRRRVRSRTRGQHQAHLPHSRVPVRVGGRVRNRRRRVRAGARGGPGTRPCCSSPCTSTMAPFCHRTPARSAPLRLWSEQPLVVAPSSSVEVGAQQPSSLQLDGRGSKRFWLRAPKAGRMALFTQHLPSEFGLRLLRGVVVRQPLEEQPIAAGHSHDEQITPWGSTWRVNSTGERLNRWISQLLRERAPTSFA